MTFDELFADRRIMVILRGLSPMQTVAMATRAWDLGIETVEVPIGTIDQVASLEAAVRAGADRGMAVGAGTVVSAAQVRTAVEAGAQYTVAPGLDLGVLASSLSAGLPHLPGVATATEVQRARSAGCRWVKAFPANVLGPDWFSAMNGPFPDLCFVATGGMSASTASGFLAAGARMVAVGAALSDPREADLLAHLLSLSEAGDGGSTLRRTHSAAGQAGSR